jgi:hypothetical protein
MRNKIDDRLDLYKTLDTILCIIFVSVLKRFQIGMVCIVYDYHLMFKFFFQISIFFFKASRKNTLP